MAGLARDDLLDGQGRLLGTLPLQRLLAGDVLLPQLRDVPAARLVRALRRVFLDEQHGPYPRGLVSDIAVDLGVALLRARDLLGREAVEGLQRAVHVAPPLERVRRLHRAALLDPPGGQALDLLVAGGLLA